MTFNTAQSIKNHNFKSTNFNEMKKSILSIWIIACLLTINS